MKLKNVNRETTRHGKTVYYFRAGRGPKIRLPDDRNSDMFLKAMELARERGVATERPPIVRASFQKTQKRNVGITLKRAVSAAKARAKASGVGYDLDEQWALELAESQGFKCALTGIPFYMPNVSTSRNRPFTPSLDRIEAGRDYTKGNVRLVIYAINVMLMDWGTEVFERVANGYRYTKGTQNKLNLCSHFGMKVGT